MSGSERLRKRGRSTGDDEGDNVTGSPKETEPERSTKRQRVEKIARGQDKTEEAGTSTVTSRSSSSKIKSTTPISANRRTKSTNLNETEGINDDGGRDDSVTDSSSLLNNGEYKLIKKLYENGLLTERRLFEEIKEKIFNGAVTKLTTDLIAFAFTSISKINVTSYTHLADRIRKKKPDSDSAAAPVPKGPSVAPPSEPASGESDSASASASPSLSAGPSSSNSSDASDASFDEGAAAKAPVAPQATARGRRRSTAEASERSKKESEKDARDRRVDQEYLTAMELSFEHLVGRLGEDILGPVIRVELTFKEVDALIAAFDPSASFETVQTKIADSAILLKLAARLEKILFEDGKSYHVKGSVRSAKDSLLIEGKAVRETVESLRAHPRLMSANALGVQYSENLIAAASVADAAGLLAQLMTSARINSDLKSHRSFQKAKKLDWRFALFCRPFDDRIRPEVEFRCFLQNGSVVAITQDFDYLVHPWASSSEAREARKGAICSYLHELKPTLVALGLETVCIDVFLLPPPSADSEKAFDVRIVDVNPIADLTGTGLFDRAELDELLLAAAKAHVDEQDAPEAVFKWRAEPTGEYHVPQTLYDAVRELEAEGDELLLD